VGQLALGGVWGVGLGIIREVRHPGTPSAGKVNEGFPGGSVSKETTCNAGDLGLILGLGNPLKKGMTNHFSLLAWRIP